MELCTEALEETMMSEEAQSLFNKVVAKFQEVAALAFFNWGNVHMCAARKKIPLDESAGKEVVDAQLQAAYDWGRGVRLAIVVVVDSEGAEEVNDSFSCRRKGGSNEGSSPGVGGNGGARRRWFKRGGREEMGGVGDREISEEEGLRELMTWI